MAGRAASAIAVEVSRDRGGVAAPSTRDHELTSVQFLRGIAAMMVVAFHSFPQLMRMGYTGNEHHSLSAGVDIFFVISGFIMLYSAHRSPRRGAAAFLINRAIRILPTYWMLTTFMVVVALFLPSLLQSTTFDLRHVVMSYLMLPSLHPTTHMYQPILIPGWTLNCEAFFYALFALGLWLVRDRGRWLMWTVAAIITGFVLAPLVVPVAGVMTFYTSSVMVEFVFGLLAARVFLAGHRLPRGVGPVLIALGAAGLVANDYLSLPDIRGVFFGIPSFLVFIGAVFAPRQPGKRHFRLLPILGDASYAIYLTHMVTMSAVGQAWRRTIGGTMPGNTIVFIVVSMAICAIGGIIFYRLVEAPVTDWLKAVHKQIGQRRRTAPVSGS